MSDAESDSKLSDLDYNEGTYDGDVGGRGDSVVASVVKDKNNLTVVGARVQFFNLGSIGDPITTVELTDHKGQFAFPRVTSGSYIIREEETNTLPDRKYIPRKTLPRKLIKVGNGNNVLSQEEVEKDPTSITFSFPPRRSLLGRRRIRCRPQLSQTHTHTHTQTHQTNSLGNVHHLPGLTSTWYEERNI